MTSPTYSNGAVYADFDNDGDLDIAVNNIDEEAYLYRNNTDTGTSIKIMLEGSAGNRNALGAKLIVYRGTDIRIMEKFPVRGFQSSMEIPLLAGTGTGIPDSMILVWPDNSFEKIRTDSLGKQVKLVYRQGLPRFNYGLLHPAKNEPGFENIADAARLKYLHVENPFVEFNREPLMPFYGIYRRSRACSGRYEQGWTGGRIYRLFKRKQGGIVFTKYQRHIQ